MPASEKMMDVSSTAESTTHQCATCREVNDREIIVTTAPTIRPRRMPPHMYPRTISQFGSGETSNSSMCLPNFAPKNDDTTLPYEFVMTDIMMRPGAMYCM